MQKVGRVRRCGMNAWGSFRVQDGGAAPSMCIVRLTTCYARLFVVAILVAFRARSYD